MQPYGTNRKGQPIIIEKKSNRHKKGRLSHVRNRMYKGFNGSHRQFAKRQIINILNELN
jgi:hypothetical protein